MKSAPRGAEGPSPWTGRRRLLVGYATMFAALAAVVLIAFPVGSARNPAPDIAGIYRVSAPSACLGTHVEVVQSGRFVNLSGEAAGKLEIQRGRLVGEVRCVEGEVVGLRASRGTERSLEGFVGGEPLRATLIRELPRTRTEPAPPEGSEELSPEQLFGRLMLAIAVVILAAQAAGAIASRIGQPRVMGEVLAGILLGPTLLGAFLPAIQQYLFPREVVPLLGSAADIGLAFYMFLVGLEVDPRVLRGRVAQAAFISNASVTFPMLLGIAVAVPLFTLVGPSTSFAPFALFMGVALSITAFPVLARMLIERRMLKRSVGATAMASAAVGDVSAWFLLAIATAVATPEGSSLAAFRIVALAILFIAGMALVVRRLVGRVSEAYDEAGQVPAGWVAAIFVGVLLSTFMASWIGVAAIFGSFVMGLIMPRRADLTNDVTRRLEDFVVMVMLPLFFAVTGLRVEIDLLDRPILWAITLALVAVAMLGKWVSAMVAALYTGFRIREATALGALMNTRGLTELIVLTVGLNHGVISPALFTMLVIMAVATTLMAGPALRLIDPRRELSAPPEEDLRSVPTARQVDAAVPERSILVAPQSDHNLDALVALAQPLAASQPPREVILARLVPPPRKATGGPIAEERLLTSANRALHRRRNDLVRGRLAARATAFVSASPGEDLVRLATQRDVDLLLVDGRRPMLGEGVPRGDVGMVLERAPCDVAVLVEREGMIPEVGPDRPIAVPFEGVEQDWAALELAAWIAGARDAPVRLLGTAPTETTGDADRLLDHASVVVRQLAGVPAQPVLVSGDGIAEAAAGAGLFVVGVSQRRRREGLGSVRSEIARSTAAPVLFVRRGTRAGALAPRDDVTRFTWSRVASVPGG